MIGEPLRLCLREPARLDVVVDVADGAPHLQVVDDDGGKVPQVRLVPIGEAARPGIEQAERSDTVRGRGDQRRAGIKADMKRADDERAFRKAIVERSIANDEHVVVKNGVAAEGNGPVAIR